MIGTKCKICRRLGQKLFLKGEKCFSPKCPMIKRPYPPGNRRKKRFSSLSEYGRELREKQRLKQWYNLREAQLRKYVKEVLEKKGKLETVDLLIRKLEGRLDSIIFRIGFAISRSQAKQLVSHGYFLVNNKKVKSPSYQVKTGDKITISPHKKNKKISQDLFSTIKKYQPPSWLKLDKENLEGEVVGKPTLKEVDPPVEISSVFEFYSR